jgi:hypothetical protein
LGALEAYPIEIMHIILGNLDLKTLTNFRSVSYSARLLVDTMKPYTNIMRLAPNSIRALLSTDMAIHFNSHDIFNALCEQDCYLCGNEFGPFMDLFTSKRVCCNCVTAVDTESLYSATPASAQRILKLTANEVQRLPTLRTLYTVYGNRTEKVLERVSVVRIGTAALKVSPLVKFNDVLGVYQRSLRFGSLIRIPTYHQKEKSLHWGFSCRSCCCPQYPKLAARNKVFLSVDNYLEHYQECKRSQKAKQWLESLIESEMPEEECKDSKVYQSLLHRLNIYFRTLTVD